MTTLAARPAAGASIVPTAVAEDVAQLLTHTKAPATWRAYRAEWNGFARWCRTRGLDPLPATVETVVWWLQDQAAQGYAVSTIARRLVTIGQAHRKAGHEPPTSTEPVRAVWAGVRRRLGTAQRQVAPATIEVLRRMVATCDDRPGGIRDRALLVVGFAGAFRRSEVAALDVEDLEYRPDGVVVTLRRSKTDQEGAGRRIGLPYGSNPDTCPIRTLDAWTATAGVDRGALFRPVDRHGNIAARYLSGRAVAEIVKRRAAAAGLDPADYSGHSLRAGFATSAAAAGATETAIARQTGHRSMAVLRRYIREGDIFRTNAATVVGL